MRTSNSISEPNFIATPPRRLKHPLLVLSLALVALVTVGWVLCGFGKEPYYQGKPASYWLDRADKSTGDLRPSDDAFAAMGSEATSFLVWTLRRKPSGPARLLSELASNPKLPAWLERLLANTPHLLCRRVIAARYLAKLGPQANSALPTLWRILEDPTEDASMKAAVLYALRSMGERTALLIPEFMRSLKTGNAEVRMAAAEFLGSLGPKTEPAVRALVEALGDPSPRFRRAVSDVLARLGASPEDLTPQLGELLRNRQIRAEILNTLLMLRSGGKKAAEMLAGVFSDSEPSEQRQILYLLEGIGEQAGPAVPTLVAALSNGDGEIRYLAARVLGQIGPEANPAVPALKERLHDEKDMIKTAAGKALKKILSESTVDPP